jgi:hypothetical protein
LSERWSKIDKETLQAETDALRAEINAELALSSSSSSLLSANSSAATPATLSVPSTPAPKSMASSVSNLTLSADSLSAADNHSTTPLVTVTAAPPVSSSSSIASTSLSSPAPAIERKNYPLLRVGVIGAGANTRTKHIPLLQCLENVRVTHIANRTLESSEGLHCPTTQTYRPLINHSKAVAAQCKVSNACASPDDVINHPDIDAVVIGTWPCTEEDIFFRFVVPAC